MMTVALVESEFLADGDNASIDGLSAGLAPVLWSYSPGPQKVYVPMMMGLFRDCVPPAHPATPPVAAEQQTHTQTLQRKYNTGKVTNTRLKEKIVLTDI